LLHNGRSPTISRRSRRDREDGRGREEEGSRRMEEDGRRR